jgi:hypothetical protein
MDDGNVGPPVVVQETYNDLSGVIVLASDGEEVVGSSGLELGPGSVGGYNGDLDINLVKKRGHVSHPEVRRLSECFCHDGPINPEEKLTMASLPKFLDCRALRAWHGPLIAHRRIKECWQ